MNTKKNKETEPTEEELEEMKKAEAEFRASLDPQTRERLEEVDERYPEEVPDFRRITGMEGAMVGTMENEYGHIVPVYERSLCIECLVEHYREDNPDWDDDQLYTAAEEWMLFNTERSLPYEKPYSPVIINGFYCDTDLWRKFHASADN